MGSKIMPQVVIEESILQRVSSYIVLHAGHNVEFASEIVQNRQKLTKLHNA